MLKAQQPLAAPAAGGPQRPEGVAATPPATPAPDPTAAPSALAGAAAPATAPTAAAAAGGGAPSALPPQLGALLSGASRGGGADPQQQQQQPRTSSSTNGWWAEVEQGAHSLSFTHAPSHTASYTSHPASPAAAMLAAMRRPPTAGELMLPPLPPAGLSASPAHLELDGGQGQPQGQGQPGWAPPAPGARVSSGQVGLSGMSGHWAVAFI